MQDLNDMVLFADVIEHGGFTAASRVLGIPKSRLSRRIASLERQLGLQLMYRSTRRLSLTPDGELFLRHCRDMRSAAQNAYEAVAQVHSEPCGTVRMSCPLTLALGTLATELPVFQSRYPLVQLDVRVLNRPVDPIEERFDLALRVRTHIEDSSALVARTFGSSRSIVVASPELMQQQPPIVEPADLADRITIAMNASDGRSSWRLQGPDGQSHVHWHTPRYIADDLHMLVQAAVHGSGIAMLPEFVCREELQSGKLIQLLAGWEPLPGIVHAVYPAGRTQVPAVRDLVEFLADTFNGYDSRDYTT
ncbi:LysR family transcriptional regulator [Granulosicoccus sp. 3-233]|uniref:LysR family transcriptional regulator n=1 Tax=Granulosicoccus sp. 3-233 TaxID=3417969 RepID=UPI003D343649